MVSESAAVEQTQVIDASTRAEASSAHARINVPINVNNWDKVPQKFHDDLLWFHQHILDEGLSWTEVEKTVNYASNTIFKFLKGISEGSYDNFIASIRQYRKLYEARRDIKTASFAENPISRLIWNTLDYTFANRCMTLIIGPSCIGKSTSLQEWRDRNNHGRSVYVDCPPTTGMKSFLRAIAGKVGVNKGYSLDMMLEGVVNSMNENRILLLDNMHRAIPSDGRSSPKIFDVIQHIFDESGCSIAMSATARLDSQMRHSDYMFEQIKGRVGIPVYLPDEVKSGDIMPIVRQYLKPSASVMEHCLAIANGEGKIRQLCEMLKIASKIAQKSKREMQESDLMKALSIRKTLSANDKVYRKIGKK